MYCLLMKVFFDFRLIFVLVDDLGDVEVCDYLLDLFVLIARSGGKPY
jgi:hypothetical protein